MASDFARKKNQRGENFPEKHRFLSSTGPNREKISIQHITLTITLYYMIKSEVCNSNIPAATPGTQDKCSANLHEQHVTDISTCLTLL
jgi:hypothetical protein